MRVQVKLGSKRIRGKVAMGIGTSKGGYLLLSDTSRKSWKRFGPFLKDQSVNNIVYIPKNKKLYAATLTEGVFVSKDYGRTWKPINQGLHVRKVWTVEADPNLSSTLYAGTHYGHLFNSKDGGGTWKEVTGLHKAPERNEWGVDWGLGTTGLCIHTVRADPSDNNRIFIVSSGAGPYRSDDRGETWKLLQEGVMESCPTVQNPDGPKIPIQERTSDLGKHLNMVHTCTHKLVLSRNNHEIIYQQNHCGVYRSSDAGEHWEDISPSNKLRHGFSIALVEDGGSALYTIPAFQGACQKHNSCVVGELAVYRSKDGGAKWEKLDNGLPKKVHTCVLRDALATDFMSPAGLYFGTTTGEIYGTKDGGDSWSQMLKGVDRIQGVSSFKLT